MTLALLLLLVPSIAPAVGLHLPGPRLLGSGASVESDTAETTSTSDDGDRCVDLWNEDSSDDGERRREDYSHNTAATYAMVYENDEGVCHAWVAGDAGGGIMYEEDPGSDTYEYRTAFVADGSFDPDYTVDDDGSLR